MTLQLHVCEIITNFMKSIIRNSNFLERSMSQQKYTTNHTNNLKYIKKYLYEMTILLIKTIYMQISFSCRHIKVNYLIEQIQHLKNHMSYSKNIP